MYDDTLQRFKLLLGHVVQNTVLITGLFLGVVGIPFFIELFLCCVDKP